MANSRKRQESERYEQLLPGIPDEITLQEIAPKLPWPAFDILTTVNSRWHRGIRTPEVYNARVRSHSTETLVLIDGFDVDKLGNCIHSIALYSMRDSWSRPLPPIPDLKCGIPMGCQCISLHGKVYVLGGVDASTGDRGSDKVYVLDMVEQRQPWKQCSNMLEPREEFGCAAIEGKIYVFGGRFNSEFVCGSEVYDPKENTWSSIRSMSAKRFGHQVAVVGEELIVHGGMVLCPDPFDRTKKRNSIGGFDKIQRATFLDIYLPVQDTWRVVEHFEREGSSSELLFPAEGKLHSISDHGIYVRAPGENLWKSLHSFSLDAIGPSHVRVRPPSVVVVVGDELLALVSWMDFEGPRSYGCYLIRSHGFGSEGKKIVWEEVQFPTSPVDWLSPPLCFHHIMCPIEL